MPLRRANSPPKDCLARAELAFAGGDAEQCLSLTRFMADELDRLHLKYWLPQTLLLQAKASVALGEKNQAVELLEKGRSAATEMGSSWSLRPIAMLLGELKT